MQRRRCSQCLTLWCETDDKCPRCNHPRAMNISTINAISLAHSNMMVRRVLVQARQEVEHVTGPTPWLVSAAKTATGARRTNSNPAADREAGLRRAEVMMTMLMLPVSTQKACTCPDVLSAALDARAEESRAFWDRERAVMKLADSLLGNEFPAEVVRDLKDIADALLEARGFEPVFKETARAARVFVEIKRHPVAQR